MNAPINKLSVFCAFVTVASLFAGWAYAGELKRAPKIGDEYQQGEAYPAPEPGRCVVITEFQTIDGKTVIRQRKVCEYVQK